jgi:hypothetical protein
MERVKTKNKISELTLFNYGIQSEESHLRAHVCPKVKRIYVYPTSCGIAALQNGIETLGYQPGAIGPTANGRRVKPFDIEKCVALQINDKVWKLFKFKKDESTTVKGEKAANLVKAMITAGIFPLPISCLVDTDMSKRIQIQGADVFVWTLKGRIHIQVKCDFIGGERYLGGSGYLYLQTAERNPLKKF